MSRLLSLGLLLASLALLRGPGDAPPVVTPAPEAVNGVVGDAGFAAAFGRAPTAADPEAVRLRTHLAYVEGALRARDVSGLDLEAQAARARLLDTLAAYRRAGVFPRNTASSGRAPVFIDEGGRICAVGRLVEASVGRDAAEAIAAAHRLDRIAEMPASAVGPWAAAHGFSLVELAMIQPTYCGSYWGNGPCPESQERVDETVEMAALAAGGLAAAANAALLAGDRQRWWVGGAGVLVGGGLVALGVSGNANWSGADVAVGGAALASGLWQALRPMPGPGTPEVVVAPVRVSGQRTRLGLAARWTL